MICEQTLRTQEKNPCFYLHMYNNNIDQQTAHGFASSCPIVYMSTKITFIKHSMKS